MDARHKAGHDYNELSRMSRSIIGRACARPVGSSGRRSLTISRPRNNRDVMRGLAVFG
jgi:hypothetical protein